MKPYAPFAFGGPNRQRKAARFRPPAGVWPNQESALEQIR